MTELLMPRWPTAAHVTHLSEAAVDTGAAWEGLPTPGAPRPQRMWHGAGRVVKRATMASSPRQVLGRQGGHGAACCRARPWAACNTGEVS